MNLYFDFDSRNKGTIFSNILALIKVNDKFITTIDFGSFKKSEDEGLNIRQLNTETLKFILTQSGYTLVNHKAVMEALLEGMEDIVDDLSELKEQLAFGFIQRH